MICLWCDGKGRLCVHGRELPMTSESPFTSSQMKCKRHCKVYAAIQGEMLFVLAVAVTQQGGFCTCSRAELLL